MGKDVAPLTVSRRVLIGSGVAFLAGCTKYAAALPVPESDNVQVTADLRRHPPLSIAPAASDEAPTSMYCGGKPRFCSMTHVRDIRDPRAVGALTDFVNARLNGWYESWAEPIPEVEILFQRGGKTVATFGSGPRFFSRGSFPAQKILTAAATDIATFHRLTHIA